MRKQWSCSKCGFACSPKPIVCNTCRSNNKVHLDPNCPKQSVNEEAKDNPSIIGSSSPSSIAHENVGFSVSQIGMIFGDLTFEPTLAIPVIIPGKSLEPKVIDDQIQHHFHSGTLGDTTIQIKQQHESEQTEAEKEAIIWDWDSNKVQKKKRSKLPQYTLSPLARFINQLQQASCYGYHRRRPRLREKSAVDPKYDDILIYERCLYVAENEIGLGAELLSPPLYDSSRTTTSFLMIKEESSSTTTSETSSGLIDIPIKSNS